MAERIELPDGDFVDINWSFQPKDITTSALVCVFHGLGGSIKSNYAAHSIKRLGQAGLNSVFMHFRGCSGEPNRKASAYHSGHTDDIRHLIALARHRYPNRPLHALGFSLGANALLKYLGEERAKSPLTSAIAVSPPLVLQAGAERLNRGFSRIYQRHLLHTMKKQLEEKRACYPQLDLPTDNGNWNTFREFDDAVTAPLSGFAGVDDYYTQCSARQYLKRIHTPTRIIFSRDDPFFTPAVVPEESELSADVHFELTEKGGHVGFVSGANPFSPDYWLDKYIVELLLQTYEG